MQQNQTRSYIVIPHNAMFTAAGQPRPDAYQMLLLDAQLQHLAQIRQDIETMKQDHGVSWVLLALTVEVKASVRPGEPLTARARNTGRDGPIFRWEVSFSRSDGTTVFEAAKFYGLLNLRTRKLCKDPAFLDRFSAAEGGPRLQAVSRRPFDRTGFLDAGRTDVRPEWIDQLGHMNNVYYGRLAYEALEAAGLWPDRPCSRLEYYFSGELLPGDHIRLYLHRSEEGIQAAGIRGSDGRPSFQLFLYP